MDKIAMRDYVSSLEAMVDNKLKKWDKHRKWENGRAIHLLWQWEQVLIKIDVFWLDGQEALRLRYIAPSDNHDFTWPGLIKKTYRLTEHHVAHWAMSLLHPPIDPEDDRE